MSSTLAHIGRLDVPKTRNLLGSHFARCRTCIYVYHILFGVCECFRWVCDVCVMRVYVVFVWQSSPKQITPAAPGNN